MPVRACRALDTAQTGITMSDVDIMKYSEIVARHVRDALDKAQKSVLTVSTETGIPRTTLMRRMRSPETSPFTVTELSAIASVTGVPVTDLTDTKNKKPSAGTEGSKD